MGEHLASNIRYAVQNSLISTMKHIGMCEFDLKDYPESEITSFTLYGSSSINPHHCYGSIFYFKGNEKYCEDANIYFGCYMNVIQHHSLQNTQVQIERSNGTLSSASIKNNTVIKYWKEKDCLAINVYFTDDNGEELYKLVGLTDYYSNTKNQMIPGLFTTNPSLNDSPIVIKVKRGTDLFQIEQQIWKHKMEGFLENSNINYQFSDD